MVPLDQANVVFPAKLPGILAVPAEELRIWLEKRREPPLRRPDSPLDCPGRRRVVRANDRSAFEAAPGSSHRVCAVGHACRPPPAVGRRHSQAAAGVADGQRIECVLIQEEPAANGLHQHPGRLRHGLCLLRQRTGRPRTQPDGRGNSGTVAAGCATCCCPWMDQQPD